MSPQRRCPPGLLLLCWVLWVIALVIAGYGIWVITQSASAYLQAAFFLAGGIFIAVTGWGLYRMRRWGVVLFGVLSILGSINHLASTIQRFPDLTNSTPEVAAGAIISVLGGFLIPFALIYLTLMLWKQMK